MSTAQNWWRLWLWVKALRQRFYDLLRRSPAARVLTSLILGGSVGYLGGYLLPLWAIVFYFAFGVVWSIRQVIRMNQVMREVNEVMQSIVDEQTARARQLEKEIDEQEKKLDEQEAAIRRVIKENGWQQN